jgi:hypothetical protein
LSLNWAPSSLGPSGLVAPLVIFVDSSASETRGCLESGCSGAFSHWGVSSAGEGVGGIVVVWFGLAAVGYYVFFFFFFFCFLWPKKFQWGWQNTCCLFAISDHVLA